MTAPPVVDPGAVPPEGTPPAPPAPIVLDHADLPAELRGRSPKEVAEVWGLMRQAISAAATNASRSPEAPPAPKEPAKPSRPLKELILDDPEEAIRVVVEKTYGPVVTSLLQSAGSSHLAAAKARFPDFEKHEPIVRELLKTIPADQITERAINSAYYMAVGMEAKKPGTGLPASRAAGVVDPPTPAPAPKPAATISDTEREIAARLGKSEADYLAWRDMSDADFHGRIKVPTAEKAYGRSK